MAYATKYIHFFDQSITWLFPIQMCNDDIRNGLLRLISLCPSLRDAEHQKKERYVDRTEKMSQGSDTSPLPHRTGR